MIRVRDAVESDAATISEVYHATYGDDYCYPQFYNETALKKLIFSDDSIVIVAEDTATKKVVGVASVLLEKGAYTDLVGEFGRLAVHPDARMGGIGRLLMQERINRVANRLHVGIIEPRVIHPYSTKIATRNNFAVVGYMPRRHRLIEREDVGLMARYFGAALSLRRNHPRIVAEAYEIGSLAMEHCGITADLIVDDDAAPYPAAGAMEFEDLTDEGYTGLLRIERGRVTNREIFGPFRLHYGFFKLRSVNSRYLLAKEKNRLVGAIGFMIDEIDQSARIFELIELREDVIRPLLRRCIHTCRQEHNIQCIEIDVNAHAPRMQRTLLELGFLPVCYAPALVFDNVERLDIVKMARIFTPLGAAPSEMIPEIRNMAELVRRGYIAREIQPRAMEAMHTAALFQHLNSEQQQVLASYCALERFIQGAELFPAGSHSEKIYVLLEGMVHVHSADGSKRLASVEPGECLGEGSALAQLSHSAHARAATDVEAAVLQVGEVQRLIRQRPDIGVILYKNLAMSLAGKLQQTGDP